MKIFALVALASAAAAQTAPPVPSPFTIHEEIQRKGDAFDTATLFRRLKLPPKFAFESEQQWFSRTWIRSQIHSDYARTYLQLCYDFTDGCRLIGFEQRPDKSWRVVGHIDNFNRRSTHFEFFHDWVLVTRYLGSGTGLSGFDRSWLELTDTGYQEVLRHNLRGHRVFAGEPAIEWNVHFVKTEGRDRDASLVFLYYSRIYPDGLNGDFLDVRRLVTFTRPNGSPKYVFDAARSELTEQEIKRFFSATASPSVRAFRAMRDRTVNPTPGPP